MIKSAAIRLESDDLLHFQESLTSPCCFIGPMMPGCWRQSHWGAATTFPYLGRQVFHGSDAQSMEITFHITTQQKHKPQSELACSMNVVLDKNAFYHDSRHYCKSICTASCQTQHTLRTSNNNQGFNAEMQGQLKRDADEESGSKTTTLLREVGFLMYDLLQWLKLSCALLGNIQTCVAWCEPRSYRRQDLLWNLRQKHSWGDSMIRSSSARPTFTRRSSPFHPVHHSVISQDSTQDLTLNPGKMILPCCLALKGQNKPRRDTTCCPAPRGTR